MSFENKTIPGLPSEVKTALGITITLQRANKTAEDIKNIYSAAMESGTQITFIDPKSILNNHLKSLRLKS